METTTNPPAVPVPARLVLLAALALGCNAGTSPGRDPGSPSRSPLAAAEPDAAGPDARPEDPGPPAREVTRLDLAGYLHFAEVRAGGGPACDLGSRAGHACTMGGFRSGWGESGAEGELTWASLGRNRRATVHLPADGGGAATLLVRLDPAGADALELRSGAARLGTTALGPTDGWQTVSIPVPAGTLRRGDNALQLRLTGASRGGRQPRVDWLWLVAGEPRADLAPSWPEARVDDGPAVVSLPRDLGIGFPLRPPPSSRLAARVAGREGAAATVSARAVLEDSGEAVDLARVRVEGGQRVELSAPLDELEGRLVRLELLAEEGDALLGEPAIRQLDASPEGARDAPATSPARNLLVVLIDTLRADHLPTYNPTTRVRADGLGRLAQAGVVFEAAQAQENWTKPSVATLLTSLYPSSHGAQSGEAVLSEDVEMLGELLQAQGYATAGFIANGYVSDRFGFRQGWGTYRNYVREHRRNRADAVVDDSIAWLDSRPAGRPFFLYVHTIDPHVPYSPPSRYVDLYDPDPYSGPIVASRTAQLLADIKVGRLRPTERDRSRLEALYDGEITYGDEHFGRLVDALEERGLLADTVVWVTSDHGEEFFDHGSVGHGHNLHQELLHVPLVLAAPGLRPGRLADDVGLVDVLPTSLELLGLEPSGEAQGRSLVPLLRGEPSQLYEASFSEFLAGGRAVRSGELKLVLQGSALALYDLSTDPREQRDVLRDRPLAARHMITVLSMYLGGAEGRGSRSAPRRVHRREERPIDPETLEQLRALGYML